MEYHSSEELLNYAIEHGILDMEAVRQQYEMNERKKYLAQHPYSIWQGTDGKWRTYLPENEGRKLCKRTSEEAIHDLIISYWKEKTVVITIESVFDEWNDRRLVNKKISNATHLRNKQVFYRHYSEIKNKKIEIMTSDFVQDFLEHEIAKRNLKAKAFSNLKSITRGFLKRAKKRGLLNYSVEETFSDLDVSDREFCSQKSKDSEQIFNEIELPIVLEYLEKHQDIVNLAILFMVLTGARVGEVVALKYTDYSSEHHSFTIQRTETRYKDKEGKYCCDVKDSPKTEAGIRDAMFPSHYHWIYDAIRKQNPFGEYLFCKDGKRLNAQQVRKRLYQVCDRLEIERKSPHKARKTYGSILLDNSVDDKLIERQMGHTTITTTEKHYHKDRKTIKTKQSILDSIPEFRYAK